MALPNSTISVFTPISVHSGDLHNLPHAELLANDVALDATDAYLDSRITSMASTPNLGYKLATAAGPQSTSTGYVNFVTAAITKQSASSILYVIGKCVLYGSSESFTESIYYATLALAGSPIASSEAQFSHYGGTANGFRDTPSPMTIITGAPVGANTVSLQIKYSGYAAAIATLGSLIVLEIVNPFAL